MPPSKLYKYRSLSGDSFKYTQAIFVRREIHLSNINTFNDPFEGKFHIEQNPQQPTPDYGLGPYNFLVRQDYIKEQAHVYCLSETCEDILMWSHYASSHTGICIEFETNTQDTLFQACKSVNYLPYYNNFTVDDIVDVSFSDIVERACLFKAEQWAYEKEWRLIVRSSRILDFDFSPECLTGVILGCRISEDDERWVKDWVTQYPTPIDIRRAIEVEGDIRLRIEPIVTQR
jgi:hypothetical protein